ncbi:MAG: Gfo/Idh/MocA family oxidoreductase [Planctomycetes bacterium]|nr:Gfo/Idh/MocA family oxidoreductase [Planctomycetota bacterium]
MSSINRRHFLQTTSMGAAAFAISGTKSSGNILGANDRVRIAVAGLNGRGKSHISGWGEQENVEIVSLIDPDQDVLEQRLRQVEGAQGFADVRKALEDKNLDAISIATPNHWHSLMTIWAAQAGKHVYAEKPMSHDCDEGRVVVEAQKRYGVVIQHGTQRRSDAKIAGLVEAIQAGKYGKLKISYGYCCKPRKSIGFESTTTPPKNLDWDLWRGPAIIDEYHANYVHYDWHWFWQSGNGDMNNQGTHQLDVARWALDTDLTHPTRVMALGGRFEWNDQGETPNTMFAIAEYPNGQYVFFNVRNVNYKDYQRQVENEYYFEDGGKIVGGKYYAKGSNDGETISVKPGHVTPGGNWGSFIAAVRAGDPEMANGTAQEAHHACVLGHLMNNSYRLGQEVPFNAKAGEFSDNPDASEHFLRLHEVMGKGVGISEKSGKYTVGPWLNYDAKTERHVGEHAQVANVLLKDNNRTGFKVPTVRDV